MFKPNTKDQTQMKQKLNRITYTIFFFNWNLVSEAFGLTKPKRAYVLSKEFPTSTLHVIQEVIKFPQSNGPLQAKKVNCNGIFYCNNFHFVAINFYRNES